MTRDQEWALVLEGIMLRGIKEGRIRQSLSSTQLASVLRHADVRWFRTKLRSRLDDSDRLMWKERFCVRAVSLAQRYGSLKSRRWAEASR